MGVFWLAIACALAGGLLFRHVAEFAIDTRPTRTHFGADMAEAARQKVSVALVEWEEKYGEYGLGWSETTFKSFLLRNGTAGAYCIQLCPSVLCGYYYCRDISTVGGGVIDHCLSEWPCAQGCPRRPSR